jgi:hypothetical protein
VSDLPDASIAPLLKIAPLIVMEASDLSIWRELDAGQSPEQEIEAFIEGAARGEQPVPVAEIGNVNLATLAIVESLRTGRPVRVAEGRLSER